MSAYANSSVTNRCHSSSSRDDDGRLDVHSRANSNQRELAGRKASDGRHPLASSIRIIVVAAILAALVIAVLKFRKQEEVSVNVGPPLFENQLPSLQVSDKLLHVMLEAADSQYKINTAARLSLKQGQLVAKMIDIRELKEDWLLPLYPCPLEGRFGLWGEGGKWVCLRHHAMRRPPLVISVGSKGDISFEEDVFNRLGGFSHTFDFSLSAEEVEKMHSYPFLKFYKLGLWGSTQKDYYLTRFPNATFMTVPEILKTVGANYVDIFKVDCEGCEHMVVEELGRIYTRNTVPFGQILMEIHWLHVSDVQLQTLLTLEKLGYRMFHTEVNAYWDEGFEIALIHEKLIDPRL